jgi:hypothetical protein
MVEVRVCKLELDIDRGGEGNRERERGESVKIVDNVGA